MTTPKKPAETASDPGESEAMGEILASFRLIDKETDWMDNAKCHTSDGISWFKLPCTGTMSKVRS
jgi:hypothetical protein